MYSEPFFFPRYCCFLETNHLFFVFRSALCSTSCIGFPTSYYVRQTPRIVSHHGKSFHMSSKWHCEYTRHELTSNISWHPPSFFHFSSCSVAQPLFRSLLEIHHPLRICMFRYCLPPAPCFFCFESSFLFSSPSVRCTFTQPSGPHLFSLV